MPELNIAALEAANARAAEIGPGVAFACEVLAEMADVAEPLDSLAARAIRLGIELIKRKEREL